MGLEEYKGVFVFAQQVDNVLDGVAFELLGKGKELAKDLNTEVTAVLIGSGVKELADQLAEYGADRVIVVDDPQLKDYRTEPYAHAPVSYTHLAAAILAQRAARDSMYTMLTVQRPRLMLSKI